MKVYVVISYNVFNDDWKEKGVMIDSIKLTEEAAENRVEELRKNGVNDPYWESYDAE